MPRFSFWDLTDIVMVGASWGDLLNYSKQQPTKVLYRLNTLKGLQTWVVLAKTQIRSTHKKGSID